MKEGEEEADNISVFNNSLDNKKKFKLKILIKMIFRKPLIVSSC